MLKFVITLTIAVVIELAPAFAQVSTGTPNVPFTPRDRVPPVINTSPFPGTHLPPPPPTPPSAPLSVPRNPTDHK